MPRLPRRSATAVTCPACGSDNARVVPRREQFHEPDVQGEYRYEITECDACGEAILSFEQAEAQERAYAAAVARERNAMTADRIFDLRMKLGKSQPQMEEAFGVGPKTWGRWERGEIVPTGPAARLMWLAERHPAVFAQLADANGGQPERHIKVVGAIAPQGPGESAVAFKVAKSADRRTGLLQNGDIDSKGGAV